MNLKTAKGTDLEIIKFIAPWWKQLGLLMDFDEEGQIVDLIEAKHKSKFVCCQEIFKRWLKGPDATWENLIQLLCDCEHESLAKEIKDALGLINKFSVHVQDFWYKPVLYSILFVFFGGKDGGWSNEGQNAEVF